MTVKLMCQSGLVQYADSPEAMLASYNEHDVPVYELRTDPATGEQSLWHKGHDRMIGWFEEAA